MNKRTFLPVVFTIIAFVAACNLPEGSTITSELLQPVQVSLSGKVSALDTGNALPGILVRVQRLDPSDDSTAFVEANSAVVSATSAADGTFVFATSISLDVDSYQYYLYLSDPGQAYFDNDSTVIYAMRNSSLSYANLKMAAKAPASYTVVSGTVVDLLEGTAVAGLTVTLTNANDGSSVFTAITDDAGAFSVDKVPVAVYDLNLDGSGLSPAYIEESNEVILDNEPANALGDILVSPAFAGDDLRIVLSWTDPNLNLDSFLTMPAEGFDFNHLGRTQVELPSSLFSVNDAFRFAEGTGYWPASMGGDDSKRIKVFPRPPSALTHVVDPLGTPRTVAELNADSSDGSAPEVLTLYKTSPLAGYPGHLAYYHYFQKGLTYYDYYPVGMAVYSVVCTTAEGSLYASGATVKVYQGTTFLGKFTAADLHIDAGESNRRYWPVLQVEIGFTTPDPTSDDDVYFRVVPFGSGQALPGTTYRGFFYQETYLPGNETFLAFVDQDTFGRDFLFVPAPGFQRVVVADSGNVYVSEVDADAHQPWQLAPGVSGLAPKTAAFYWMHDSTGVREAGNLYADALYLARQTDGTIPALVWAPASSSRPTENESWDLAQSGDMTLVADTTVHRVNDSCIVRFRGYPVPDEHRFLLLATDKGPRGASTVLNGAYSEREPLLGSIHPGWTDATDGLVLTGASARALTHVLPARDRYGAVGVFALVGGNGLFRFVADAATYDATYADEGGWANGEGQRAAFYDVVNIDAGSTCDLSSADFTVGALAEFPTMGDEHVFFAAGVLNDGGFLTPKLYRLRLEDTGLRDPAKPVYIEEVTAPASVVNDLMFVYVDSRWLLLAATNDGLYVSGSSLAAAGSVAWNPHLADMLGGFVVTKLIDYGGRLGLLVAGNGLIYGPYPE